MASNDERSTAMTERVDEGAYEIEESNDHDWECCLPYLKKKCAKHPGHDSYISADQLRLEHLPEAYRDEKILRLVKCNADLTVCIDVGYTSTDRPNTVPNSTQSYVGHAMRGRSSKRHGTGWIEIIHDYGEHNTNVLCKCQECGTPAPHETAHRKWAKVVVQTAKHVVFDDQEAKHTTIKVFYDCEQMEALRYLYGEVKDSDINKDWILIHCYTHDMDLVERLLDSLHTYETLRSEVYAKYSNGDHKLVAIASHPHGCCKLISVGEWLEKEVTDKGTRFTYTAATCMGSSGARVWILGAGEDCKGISHQHSKALDKQRGISGIGWY